MFFFFDLLIFFTVRADEQSQEQQTLSNPHTLPKLPHTHYHGTASSAPLTAQQKSMTLPHMPTVNMMMSDSSKQQQPSRASSLEIENLVKVRIEFISRRVFIIVLFVIYYASSSQFLRIFVEICWQLVWNFNIFFLCFHNFLLVYPLLYLY